ARFQRRTRPAPPSPRGLSPDQTRRRPFLSWKFVHRFVCSVVCEAWYMSPWRSATMIEEPEAGPDRASSLTGVVYERLRSEIVRGELRPNERLIEAEIADRLKVSRTPVRESLQRLAADGLVVSRRRGWVVYEHSMD